MSERPSEAEHAAVAIVSPRKETAERWAAWLRPVSRDVEIVQELPERAAHELWVVDWERFGARFTVARLSALGPAILAVGNEEARPFADDTLPESECALNIAARARALLRAKRAEVEVEKSLGLLRSVKLEQHEVIQFLLHDIKNPLAVVHANLEFLRGHDFGGESELSDALDDAREASRRIQRMIEDTQLVNRLESGDLRPSPKPFALFPALDAAKRGVSREAQRKSLALSLEVDPSATATVDPVLFRRALDNLLEAALRHTPRGGRILAEAISDPSGVRLTVADTGAPVQEDERVKVFDKTGAGRERGRSLGNVGLGFYLCRLIAEAHHGTIELGHRPEWPTCFQLWLSQSSR
jgi:signal transduction histidine kinase